MKLKSTALKAKAQENANVTKGNKRNGFETLKEGKPLDSVAKNDCNCGQKFGVSKGITKNMGDYESLRVEVWLTDSIQPKETPQEAIHRVNEILDEVIEEIVLNTVNDYT